MILYKEVPKERQRKRKERTIKITIEEMPQRPSYVFKKNTDRVMYIKMVEALIRKSKEYKDYIKFLKETLDWNKCAILSGVAKGNGKKYSIEIHHEPFNLFDYVDTEITRLDMQGLYLNPFVIAENVMKFHYDGEVGLIPLAKTQHELVGDGQIFIPLQYIYHDYAKYFMENQDCISDNVKDKLAYKLKMSQKCDEYQSNVLNAEFVYVDIDGFPFPKVPEEWGQLIQENLRNNIMYAKDKPKKDEVNTITTELEAKMNE